MGAFLDKPKTEKTSESGTGNGLRYGLSSMQGWRVEMEDAHCAVASLPGKLVDWSFFAIFDGHAGAKVSEHCSKELLRNIIENEVWCGGPNDSSAPTIESVSAGIKTGFLQLDRNLRDLPETLSGEDKSGSTAVCTIIAPSHVYFANCGDSRAVLSRGGRMVFGTADHKPANPLEKERIQNAGGSVMIQRVNGSLAVSRALGDFEYKNVPGRGPCEQLVSPEPEVTVEERTGEDEFIALACDGVWDVMSNEDLCDFVRDRMRVTDDLKEICNLVIDTCLNKGSRDNMSIIIVAFSGAPSVSNEAKEKERKLDALLEARIKDIVDSNTSDMPTTQYIVHLLTVDDIEGLPPGGGIQSKRSKIEEILNRHSKSSTSSSSSSAPSQAENDLK